MLPVIEPDGRSTTLQALIYGILLIPISLSPVLLGMSGPIYFWAALVLGLAYLAAAIRFRDVVSAPNSAGANTLARQLLQTSVLYLPLLMTAMMLNARGQ
jgi:protoheme IX farnesyltransferase